MLTRGWICNSNTFSISFVNFCFSVVIFYLFYIPSDPDVSCNFVFHAFWFCVVNLNISGTWFLWRNFFVFKSWNERLKRYFTWAFSLTSQFVGCPWNFKFTELTLLPPAESMKLKQMSKVHFRVRKTQACCIFSCAILCPTFKTERRENTGLCRRPACASKHQTHRL